MFQPSRSCTYLVSVLGHNLTTEEMKWFSSDLNEMAETLEKVPEKARRMLLRFIKKSHDGTSVYIDDFATERYSDEGQNLERCVTILKRNGLAEFSENIDGEGIIELSCNLKGGNNLWGEIKKFCEIEKISLEQIIIDLNFSIFDDKINVKNTFFD